jgi:hypothetical protein
MRGWASMLSYETDWMSRDEIVATTYEVGRRLNDLKYEAGLIDRRTHDTVADHLASATGVLAEVRTVNGLAEPERTQRLRALKTAMPAANSANLVGEDELKWRIRTGIRVSLMLVRIVVRALGRNWSTRSRGIGAATTPRW